MAYEGEHRVDTRSPTWLRWTGSVLALVTGTIVGVMTNFGAGFVTTVMMYSMQRLVSGAGFERAARRKIRIQPGRLDVGDFHIVKRTSRLALPEIVKEGEETKLRLRTRFRIIDVDVASASEASSLIETIGLKDARQISAFLWTTPLPNWIELGFLLAIPGALLLFASIYWASAVAPIVVVSAFLTLLVTTLRFYRAEVEATIGRDGIVLRQGWLPPRFIRHGSIMSVSATKAEVLLELAGGERIRFSTTLESEPTDADFDQAKAIAERIEKARTTSAELPAAPTETPGLLRGPRTAKEWLEGLRKLGEGGETAFRDSTPPRDHLWQIIESIDAPALERIAAAIALKTSGLSPEEAPRLRIAADGAVEPKLGARLRVVTDENEEALANVLEEAQKEA